MFQDGSLGTITPASLPPPKRRARSSVGWLTALTLRAITLPEGSHVPATFLPPPRPMLARKARWRVHAPPKLPPVREENLGGTLITPVRDWSQALPFQQFHVLFNSLSKVLFIFRSLYLFAIGLPPVFSFRWNLPPALSCIPKQLDSSKAPRMDRGEQRATHGVLTLHDALFQGT